MTPTDHNKVLGIMYLIYGGLNAISLLIVIPFILISVLMVGSGEGEAMAVGAVFFVIAILTGLLTLLFSLPPLVAAYGLLKHKAWARTAGIVAAVVASLGFPLGTALCFYALWFFFGEGKAFYAGGVGAGAQWQGALGSAPASTYGWEAQRAKSERAREYVPPTQPPDWRG